MRDSTSLERIGSFMMTFFALAALLMATLGIYGVVSYAVRQATVEIGTRMALGAAGRDLLLHGRRRRLEDGRLRRGDWRGRGRRSRRVAAGAGLRDPRPRRAAVRRSRRPSSRSSPRCASFFPGMARDAALADGRHSERAGVDVAVDARRRCGRRSAAVTSAVSLADERPRRAGRATS